MKESILKDIIKFSKKVRGCKLKKRLLQSEDDFMIRVDNYFGTTRLQSILAIAIFDLNSEDTSPNLKDLAKHLSCNVVELFVYKNDFIVLEKRGLLTEGDFISFMGRKSNTSYNISDQLKKSIALNVPFKPKPKRLLSSIEICDEVKTNIEKCKNSSHDILDAEVTCRYIFEAFTKNDFINYLKKKRLSHSDYLVYMYVIADNIDGNKSSVIHDFTSGIFEDKVKQIRYEKSLCTGSSILIKQDLLKLNSSNFISSSTVSLTKKASKDLEQFDIPIRLAEDVKQIELKTPNQITSKKLFYEANALQEIEALTKYLKPSKFKQIKKALQLEGFNTGVCTLMYGAPGTGKTETVYQIAKQTGRAVWNVDLSELKSMWFGESQKLVKGLFTDYKNLSKDKKRSPILLLNEADAVLGKRNAHSTGSTGKTENAIQNIILDCLENFEGILFATTNLESSLDSAFERRFLFKLKFERPDTATKAKIWKSKLKKVPSDIIHKLAATYDFSGGDIDNVVRKLKMANVLQPQLDISKVVFNICDAEKITHSSQKLGF